MGLSKKDVENQKQQVNFPAYLVVVKDTKQYSMGRFVDIDTSQVLQMIGRAGRPQFDSSGVAVIMTDLGTEVSSNRSFYL